MHAEFAGGLALIAAIFLEHRDDEAFFELAYRFGIKNIALIHLKHEGFQLIFHRRLFSAPSLKPRGQQQLAGGRRRLGMIHTAGVRRASQVIQALVKAVAQF